MTYMLKSPPFMIPCSGGHLCHQAFNVMCAMSQWLDAPDFVPAHLALLRHIVSPVAGEIVCVAYSEEVTFDEVLLSVSSDVAAQIYEGATAFRGALEHFRLTGNL